MSIDKSSQDLVDDNGINMPFSSNAFVLASSTRIVAEFHIWILNNSWLLYQFLNFILKFEVTVNSQHISQFLVMLFFKLTRMHSSRMCTARSLPYGEGSLSRGGSLSREALCSGRLSVQGGLPREQN